MIKNYLKIAWRNLIKNRVSSLINIGGLAVGMAVAMLIGLWIYDELSFDKWLPGSENLYRVDVAAHLTGRPVDYMALAPFPLPAFIKDHLPEVTAMTRLWPTRMTVQIGDRQFLEDVNEADFDGIGPHERAAEDAARKARDVVALERLEDPH